MLYSLSGSVHTASILALEHCKQSVLINLVQAKAGTVLQVVWAGPDSCATESLGDNVMYVGFTYGGK